MRDDVIIAAFLLGIGYVMLKRNNTQPGTFSPNAPSAFDQYSNAIIPTTTSSNGITFIENQEGFSPTPYPDSDGQQRWGFGTPASGSHITRLQAENELIAWLAQNVEPYINNYVTVPLDQNQFDALADFIFNVGGPAFLNSTLLQDLNAGDYAGAADQFSQWRLSGGTISQALVARRSAEQGLFNS